MGKIFGIDLGTTYSCISYVDEYGKAVVVTNVEDNSPVTPSVVAFESDGGVSVGQSAKQTLDSNPECVCSTIKRQMGNREFKFYVNDKEYSPEVISSLILKKLAQDTEEKLGEPVIDVVITCPAYFGLEEREATRIAGGLAGLNVLSVINEPTAAAISYGINVDKPQSVIVYDLGGGTFDITTIKVGGGKIEVGATDGDHNLGGKDWDEVIRTYTIEEYSQRTGQSKDSIIDDLIIMGDLELKSENAKKQLSNLKKNSAVIRLEKEQIEITRELFESKTKDLLEKTIMLTHRVMKESEKKGISSYDKILLVGGSTYMPQVKDRLSKEFPSTPIETCDPNASVAKGAAIYGINIAAFPIDDEGESTPRPKGTVDKDNLIFTIGGGGPIHVVNVISQSIAVEFAQGIANQIVKNTAIPCEKSVHAGTNIENQESVNINILQNASSDDQGYIEESKCKLLVNGNLGPLPRNLPANSPIEIILKVNSQGLLAIDAKDLTGGKVIHLEVQLSDVMSKEEKQEAEEQMKELTIM